MNEQTILNSLATWLDRSLGNPEVFVLSFDISFSAGQTIDITINTVPIAQVTAITSQAVTMELLRASLQEHTDILAAVTTNLNEITVYGFFNGQAVTVNSYIVVGGASQPEMTKTITTNSLAIPVIYAYQNAPRPNLPVYAVVSLDSIIQLGFDELREIDVNKLAHIGGQRRATVGVHYFGPNPMQEISKAYNSLEKETILAILNASGIAVWNKNAIQNVTGMLETTFQNHAFFDFTIGYAENYQDDLGTIEQAELTGIYDGVDSGSFENGPDLINQDEITTS